MHFHNIHKIGAVWNKMYRSAAHVTYDTTHMIPHMILNVSNCIETECE